MASAPPIKVLVAGGSYAGLAAAVHLLDLAQGRRTRFDDKKQTSGSKAISLDVHIVDKRDGFCKPADLLFTETV